MLMDAYVYLRKKQKLVKDKNVTYDSSLEGEDLITACLEQVLEGWDLSRPIILQRHCRDLENFGRVIFKKDDFVESFPFDQLEVELAARPDGIPEDYFDEFM